ncbi:hypothetical protein L3Y34_009311 [Caenorhabditis briggsae]|uniref:F-box domain-containing protein n=1 Tax=Caenorhabditis briggsae TaxID=6238 RepID=A0AAE9D1F1_CAEBR|nr:hypothetical protein L3Y34_009311 [Caenorhabditis briggsae]
MTNILAMPELVLEKVLKNLNFKSVLTLRHVCRDLRNYIDDSNHSKLPDSNFSKIEIYFETGSIIKWDFEYRNGSNEKFLWKIPENSNVADIAIQNLALVLKFQKYVLGRLFFHFNVHPDSKVMRSNRLLIQKIQARIVKIHALVQSQIMSILPCLDSEILEYIMFWEPAIHFNRDHYKEMEINEIVETEQWKNAKDFSCFGFEVKFNIEHFCHFSKFHLEILAISSDEFVFLKEILLNAPKFKHFTFNVQFFEEEHIFIFWGQPFTTNYKRYFFGKSNGEVLDITYMKVNHWHFDISCQKMSNVPNGAVVLNS